MAQVAFRGQLTERDIQKVTWAGLRPQVAVCSLLVIGMYLFAESVSGFRGFVIDPLGEVVALVPIIGLLIFYYLFLRSFARRSWQQNRFMHEVLTGSVSDEGFEVNSGPYSRVNAPWSFFVRYREAGDVLLIFVAPNLTYYLLPHLFASRDEFEAAREIVKRHLPRKASRRRIGSGEEEVRPS